MVIFGHEFLLPVLHIANKFLLSNIMSFDPWCGKSLVHFGTIHNNIVLLPVLLEIIYQPLFIPATFL